VGSSRPDDVLAGFLFRLLEHLVHRLHVVAGVSPVALRVEIAEDVYVHDICADVSKMREATGWEPRIGFEEGIRRVCEQYK